MLTVRLRLALAIFAAASIGLIPATSAQAGGGMGGGGTTCQAGQTTDCTVVVTGPGTGGGTGPDTGGGSGGVWDGKCRIGDRVVPCTLNGAPLGSDGCYHQTITPTPAQIAKLGGQPPGQGYWDAQSCYDFFSAVAPLNLSTVWVSTTPPPTPAVLAQEAVSKLRLPRPVIGLSPAGDQLVNLEVWGALGAGSWTTQSATASVPGVSVTAVARPLRAVWSTGDGGQQVTCTGPGTAWTAGSDPAAASPDCGWRYSHSSASAAGGMFTASVTVTWEVTWSGAGQSGTVPNLTTTNSVPLRVLESQALITR